MIKIEIQITSKKKVVVIGNFSEYMVKYYTGKNKLSLTVKEYAVRKTIREAFAWIEEEYGLGLDVEEYVPQNVLTLEENIWQSIGELKDAECLYRNSNRA